LAIWLQENEAECLIDFATLTTHQERRDARHREHVEDSHCRPRQRAEFLAHLNSFKVSVAPRWVGGFSRLHSAVQVRPKPPTLSDPAFVRSFAHYECDGTKLAAGEFNHVIVLYSKEQDIFGPTTNESLQMVCNRVTRRGYTQGSWDYGI
jgi:hypothetical protein